MTIGLFLLILLGTVATCVALGVLVAFIANKPPAIGGAIGLMISVIGIVAWALIPILNTPLNLWADKEPPGIHARGFFADADHLH